MPKRNFNTNLTKQERERIGELVKVLRNNSGISQKDLAFKVGVSLVRISEIEKRNSRLSDRYFDCKLFIKLLKVKNVNKVWFTGMLTHGQSDFVIPYIDHESHTLQSYYPDFIIQLQDDSYIILEVKADNKIDDAVVKSKQEYAIQFADASQMTYRLIPSSTIMNNTFKH